jgi:cytochrome c553
MIMYKSATLILSALILAVPAWADEMNDGRILYEQYACARCHGADAKTPRASDVPRLAGMAADRIEQNVRRFAENRAHLDVLVGCGVPPSTMEIRKIARYLASLPP